VTAPALSVAALSGSRGDITVAGPGSTLSITGATTIGASGNPASATISDGASMNTGSSMVLATGSTLAANQASVSAANFSIQSGALAVLDDAALRTTPTAVGVFSSANNGELRLAGSGAARVTGGGFSNLGLLNGNGRLDNQFNNGSSGEVRVGNGERLFFASTTATTNDGRLTLLGGTLEFAAPLQINAGGLISGRGILTANAGLTNNGQVQLSGGLTDVFGAVTSNSASKIIVSGGATATFYNNVTMNSGSEFRVSTASTAVFFGNVSGSNFFTGSGIKDFEGGSSALGPVSTIGSTIAQAPASVTASFFRENSLTVAGHVTIDSSGGTSHLNSLDVEPGGVLDLKNNSLVLENGDLQAITAQIRSGLNSGTGIVSTAPGAPFRLGSMSNAGTIYGTFQGISGLNGDEVLIRYTRIGDLNLDGTVSISDFIDLASNFNHIGGATWQMGDVNYDGSVTISDFIDLASNFGQSVSGEAVVVSDAGAAVLAAFGSENGASAVPDPACLLILPAVAILTSLRRRKLPLARLDDCGVP
jgi:T5SS/PEP-CTERM-associated repeat protein